MRVPVPNPAALAFAPLILRVVLGVTFLWAGAGKWLGEFEVQGENAATLANMGVLEVPRTPAAPPSPAAPPAKPLPQPQGSGLAGGVLTLAQTPTPSPAGPVTSAPPAATAADFPEPVPCRAVWRLALRLHEASHPSPDPQTGAPKMALWPKALGEGLWPKCLALAVMLAELVGGFCVLFGLFTRLGAVAIIGVMLGAIWLDQIGPAMQSGVTRWGFLPAHEPWDAAAWRPLLWQFALLAIAAALALLGSGVLAMDRAIAAFRKSRPAPASAAQTGGARGQR